MWAGKAAVKSVPVFVIEAPKESLILKVKCHFGSILPLKIQKEICFLWRTGTSPHQTGRPQLVFIWGVRGQKLDQGSLWFAIITPALDDHTIKWRITVIWHNTERVSFKENRISKPKYSPRVNWLLLLYLKWWCFWLCPMWCETSKMC